jgi:hypothetical protein
MITITLRKREREKEYHIQTAKPFDYYMYRKTKARLQGNPGEAQGRQVLAVAVLP